jgi:hypothetical protein
MMTGFERYTKKTRRAMFLEEMEQVVPWGKLCALIEPHYTKPGNGRRPKELEKMLRIYFPQQWFNLADPGGGRGFVRLDDLFINCCRVAARSLPRPPDNKRYAAGLPCFGMTRWDLASYQTHIQQPSL